MKQTLLLLAFLFVLAGCSKKSSQTQQQSATELLINKKWKMTSMTGKLANGTLVPDQYPGLPSSEKDDYWYFKQDLTFVDHDNLDRAPGSHTDTLDYGTWTLTNNDSYLNLISTAPQPPGSSLTYSPAKILQLNSTSMKWESFDASSGSTIWSTYITIP